MDTLYIFNPENDLALACGEPNFTAPPMARKIRDDLQMLPIWIMDSGVICADLSKINIDFLEWNKARFRSLENVGIFDCSQKVANIVPWGWSPAILSDIRRILPDFDIVGKAEVKKLRELSSRETAVTAYRLIKGKMPELQMPENPVFCRCENDVVAAVKLMGDCMIKSPWSGSGKGVFHVGEHNYKDYAPWIVSTIKKQGGIVCEKYLDKIQDFAFEFYSDGESVKYEGISVFYSNNRFSYEESLIASTADLEKFIGDKIPQLDIQNLKTAIIDVLNGIIASKYKGYFGVDMLLYRDEHEGICLQPCVEINLRITMGHIASHIGNMVIAKGKFGKMQIKCHKNREDIELFLSKQSAPVIENGKLEAGILALAPVYPASNYTATLTIVE